MGLGLFALLLRAGNRMETMDQRKVKGRAEKFHVSTRAFPKEHIKQGKHGFQGVILWHIHEAVA